MTFWRRSHKLSDSRQQISDNGHRRQKRNSSDSPLEWEFGGEEPRRADGGSIESLRGEVLPRNKYAFQRRWQRHSAHLADSATTQAWDGGDDADDILELEPESDSEDAHENGLVGAFQGVAAAPRVQAVRQALELALDDWWTQNTLLSPALLRNGLLVLEAGHKLEEAYLSLLLRSALQLRRGMLTALRHQTDPDRAAYLLKEALLYEAAPLPPNTLWWLRQEDHNSAEWVPLLLYDLKADVQVLRGPKLRLARTAMQQLQSDEPMVEQPAAPPRQKLPVPKLSPWSSGRLLGIFLFLVLLGSFYLWSESRSSLADVVFVPAGVYTIENAGGDAGQGAVEESVTLAAFAIERTEVTNRSYRLCYEQGHCPEPADVGSATREDYFFNPAFDFYPVVNIDWNSAGAYCAWAGKRLPTVAEWEVAASVAPATNRRYQYPWGDTFQHQFANSLLSHLGDTQQVGTYHPVGASSFGAEDMAGNVAEWTATADLSGAQMYVVKGGAYADPPDALRTNSRISLAAETAHPWLGFRCAETVPK